MNFCVFQINAHPLNLPATLITINFNGLLLSSTASVKYLGVVVDAKLSWNIHVSHVSAKATEVLNLLRRHLYTCRYRSKQRAFKALVIPILDYASAVWNPHTQKNISALEKIQNRGAHWVCGSRFCTRTFKWSKSTQDCNRELFWSSLVIRRNYLSVTTMYDILHNHISLHFSDYFIFSDAPTRSHSLSIMCKQSSINSYRYSFL